MVPRKLPRVPRSSREWRRQKVVRSVTEKENKYRLQVERENSAGRPVAVVRRLHRSYNRHEVVYSIHWYGFGTKIFSFYFVLLFLPFLKLSKSLNYYLEEYNGQTTRPMKLVLFLDAISHICRIARVLRQPMGNALLLGMGGSGNVYIFIRLNKVFFFVYIPLYFVSI